MVEAVEKLGQPRSGLIGFLREALGALGRGGIVPAAVILLVLLTFSNIVILQNMPAKGSPPAVAFLVAAVLRVAGLLLLSVAILRALTASPRRRWLPDGGFWLYVLTFAAGAAVSAAVAWLLGSRTGLANLILSNVLVTLLLSPLVVWFVALAVARPLAWRPGRWLRDFGEWWPPVVFWTLLLVTPMAVLHASIDMRLIAGAGDSFWPLALFDGALSTVMALLAIAINAAGYRRVAEDHGSRLSART